VIILNKNRKKARFIFIIFIIAAVALTSAALFIWKKHPELLHYLPGKVLPIKVQVPRITVGTDRDGDGLCDLQDIVEGARKDAANKPVYTDKYYRGGYPPDNEGVCTDVIWRAFKNAGYNLKDMVDKDIREHKGSYPAVNGRPDPNIDFRRVRNLYVFFKKYATSLTLELKPYDIENLSQWQGGDIVTFSNPGHIAIISDRRRNDGIPYIIHNAGPYTREGDDLLYWMSSITGHFRFPKQ
jgi:uncharacterized protein YijF (DUF1287 family)